MAGNSEQDVIDFINNIDMDEASSNLNQKMESTRWHTPDGTHTVGRDGTIVPPGGTIGTFIEENVGSGYSFGKKHDEWVDNLTKKGFPDPLVNIPTMPAAYIKSIYDDLAKEPAENRPKDFPILNIRW